MAGNATVTPTVTDQWFDGKRMHVIGTMAITGGTDYVNNGLACSFAGLVKGSSRPPEWVSIKGIAGFLYAFNVGTTQANGLFLIFVNNTGGTNAAFPQHTVAAVVSGVTGDTISFYAVFPFGR